MDRIIEEELSIEFHSEDTNEEERRNKRKMEEQFPGLELGFNDNRDSDEDDDDEDSKGKEEEEDDSDSSSSIVNPFDDFPIPVTDVNASKNPKTTNHNTDEKKRQREYEGKHGPQREGIENNLTGLAKWMMYQSYFPEEIPPPLSEDSPEAKQDKHAAAEMWQSFCKLDDALQTHQENMFIHFKSEILTRVKNPDHPMVVFYGALREFQELHVVKQKVSHVNNAWTGKVNDTSDNHPVQLILYPLEVEMVDDNDDEERPSSLYFKYNAIPEAFSICVSKKVALMLQLHHNIYHAIAYARKQAIDILPSPDEVQGKRLLELWDHVTEEFANQDAMEWPVTKGATPFVAMISQWRERLLHSFDLF